MVRTALSLTALLFAASALTGCGEDEPIAGRYNAEPYAAFRETGAVTIDSSSIRFQSGYGVRTETIGAASPNDSAANEGVPYQGLAGDLRISGSLELRRITETLSGRDKAFCTRASSGVPTHIAVGRLPEGIVLFTFTGASAPGAEGGDARLCEVYEYATPQPAPDYPT